MINLLIGMGVRDTYFTYLRTFWVFRSASTSVAPTAASGLNTSQPLNTSGRLSSSNSPATTNQTKTTNMDSSNQDMDFFMDQVWPE